MWIDHLALLACPACGGDLRLDAVREGTATTVREGELVCAGCAARYPVVRGIPRFVPDEAYAGSFGMQWKRLALVQYDSRSGHSITADRFHASSGWPRDLRGEVMLEAGCGGGRFTEVAAATGATVVSFDLSEAVEVNHALHGDRENVLVAQASLYAIPCRENFFDRLFCFGVLQHTPDPDRAFLNLPRYLKPGTGRLAVDIYRDVPGETPTKYRIRPLTTRLPPRLLYPLCRAYVALLFPLMGVVNRLLRRNLSWSLAMADYRGSLPLTPRQHRQWAFLDTFDMWSPAYDSPRSLEAMRELFARTDLVDREVEPGINGVVGRGRLRAASPLSPPSSKTTATVPEADADRR